jgi:hypothetical protein
MRPLTSLPEQKGWWATHQTARRVGSKKLRNERPPVPRNEPGLLLAFDANRALIYAAAAKAYKRERKASYELAAADF